MLQSREGKRVPKVTFRVRENNQWKNVTTDDLFAGKTVVCCRCPGAFTPTCSSTHLPRYNELAPVFFANGVDAIVCVSVNDAFVMNEWAQGPGGGKHHRSSPTATASSPRAWACWSTSAISASASARGATRCW